ncbi:MAG TPA: Gfo/Idh/MocA family oxidoreductase [Opitutaceae bacterium]|nr:Gfo/Idh/MocA family oxidoreductase [Opitutaceae bacterium]
MKTFPHGSPSALTRRDFIGRVSLGAAALSLTSRLRAQDAPPGKKLGVALVGLGYYSRAELGPALKLTNHCRLAGVVTGDRAKGESWAKDHGFSEKSIYNYDTMARIADDPAIDIVYVVTPNSMHAEHTIAAAKAGKHVICEKPMAMSVAESDAMIAACRAAKVKLSIGYRLHFDPFHQELKRHAREKDWGPFMKMTGANGFTMGRKVWRAERKLAGGGPLMDMGVYCVHEACIAADGAAPVAVTAREHPKTRPEIFADVEEGLDWTMEFANGAKAELMTSYSQSVGRFRAEAEKDWMNFQPAFGYRGIKVATSKGPLEIEPVKSQQALQMDDFALCVQENRESRVPGEMGRRDMAIIEAIYAAAATGKRTLVGA